MAKKSKIAKNEQRKVIVARYSAKRLEPGRLGARRPERYRRVPRGRAPRPAEASPQRSPVARAAAT